MENTAPTLGRQVTWSLDASVQSAVRNSLVTIDVQVRASADPVLV